MRFNIIDGALDGTEGKNDGICLLRMFLEKSFQGKIEITLYY